MARFKNAVLLLLWQARLVFIQHALRAANHEILWQQSVSHAATKRIALEMRKRADGLILEAEAVAAVRTLSTTMEAAKS